MNRFFLSALVLGVVSVMIGCSGGSQENAEAAPPPSPDAVAAPANPKSNMPGNAAATRGGAQPAEKPAGL